MGAARITADREVSSPSRAPSADAVASRDRVKLNPPGLRLTDGGVESLKWFALCLMTLDHVDKYLLHEREYGLFALGRIAFPLFATILAFNLARPGALERGVYKRIVIRLVIFGGVSEIPFVALGGLAWDWYPLNVLFTLLLSAAIMRLLECRVAWQIGLAVLVFLVGGAFVEFWWPGVALSVAAWLYFRRPGWAALLVWVAATTGLYMINGNFWSLVAFPIVVCAPLIQWRPPRIRWAFYAYYPTHLGVIWAMSRWLGPQ
jgi:TraX protein